MPPTPGILTSLPLSPLPSGALSLPPPASEEPPLPEEPPVPEEPPAPVMVPEPCKVVTLDPSKDSVTEPFEAVTLPSLARFLLLDVVNLS